MALEQPKKPVGGAFGRFVNERRAEFLKACAGQKVTAVTKMAGIEWKKLTDKEKEPFQKRYEMEKVQFEKDMAAFLEGGGVKAKGLLAMRREKKKLKEGKRAKKARDADAPKRPAGGAYGRFLAEKREDIKKSLPADHKITDVSKKAGELWKALSEAEKHKYEEMYKIAQEKYKKEADAYKAKKKAEAPVIEEPAAKTPQKERKKKCQETPKTAKKRKGDDAKGAGPEKRKGDDAKGAGPGKRAPMSKNSPKQVGIELNDDILAKARAAGYESQLKNLAVRPDVVASGSAAENLLQALEASGGLVNRAKLAILGGA